MGASRSVTPGKGSDMSKGNKTRGNREAKKPKQEKQKAPATANSLAGKPTLVVGGKKIR